jgi:hypothetical protein
MTPLSALGLQLSDLLAQEIACIETNARESKIVGVRNAKTAAW